MAASGRKTERLPELPCAIQIDTTLSRLESSVLRGFQRFALSFSRIAISGVISEQRESARNLLHDIALRPALNVLPDIGHL